MLLTADPLAIGALVVAAYGALLSSALAARQRELANAIRRLRGRLGTDVERQRDAAGAQPGAHGDESA